MKWFARDALCAGFLAVLLHVSAGETLPVFKVGSTVYSNVTVTTVTATDIFFTHPKGMGNAKLKDLGPDLQKKFKFDPAKSGEVEKRQAAANLAYRQKVKTEVTTAKSGQPLQVDVPAPIEEDGDPVLPKIYARSVRGERPPQIIIDQWLSPVAPDVKDKFVLVDFWATWCGPCRQSIPHLNELQAKFKDKLVVIGLSNESEADMRKMTEPKVGYYVGTDPQARTMTALEVKGIPHAILIDPKGIVRYEGTPNFLEAKALERLIAKYSE